MSRPPTHRLPRACGGCVPTACRATPPRKGGKRGLGDEQPQVETAPVDLDCEAPLGRWPAAIGDGRRSEPIELGGLLGQRLGLDDAVAGRSLKEARVT